MAKIDFLQSDTNEYIYPVTLLEGIYTLEGATLIDVLNTHVDAIKANKKNLLYTSELPITVDVGGVTIGTVYREEQITKVVDDILHPWVAPAINITPSIEPGTYPVTNPGGDPDQSGDIGAAMDVIVQNVGNTPFTLPELHIEVLKTMHDITQITVILSNDIHGEITTIRHNITDTAEGESTVEDGEMSPPTNEKIEFDVTFESQQALDAVSDANEVSIKVMVQDTTGRVEQKELKYYLVPPVLVLTEKISTTERDQTDEEMESSTNPPTSILSNTFFRDGTLGWVLPDDASFSEESSTVTVSGRTEHGENLLTQDVTGKVGFRTTYKVRIKAKINTPDLTMALFPIVSIYNATDDTVYSMRCIPEDQSLAIATSGDWCDLNYRVSLPGTAYSDLQETNSITIESISKNDELSISLTSRNVTDGVIDTNTNFAVAEHDIEIAAFLFTPVRTTVDYSATYTVTDYKCIEHDSYEVLLKFNNLVECGINLLVPGYIGQLTDMIDVSGFNVRPIFDTVVTTGDLARFYDMYTTVPRHGDPATNINYISINEYNITLYFRR